MSKMIDVIIVTFENGDSFYKNLQSIIENIANDINLIIIDDNFNKKNKIDSKKVNLYLKNHKVHKIKIIRNRFPKFETACENLGLKSTESRYAILIQSDMLILEKNFDEKLLKAMTKYDDLIFVSGRGVENIHNLKSSFYSSRGFQRLLNTNLLKHYAGRILQKSKKDIFNDYPKKLADIQLDENKFIYEGRIGKIGDNSLGKFSSNDLEKTRIFVGDVVMRGPLLVDIEKFKCLNFFDQKNFFQGWDDHDACIRAFIKFNWKVAFLPIQYYSDINPKHYTYLRFDWYSLIHEWLLFMKLIRLNLNWKNSYLFKFYESEIILPKPHVRFFD